jgi:predicted Zn-dependent protease
MQRGRPGDALQVLQSAPEAVQNVPAVVELKGMAQQRMGRYEAALATFEQLSAQQPDQAAGPMRMGETLLLMQRPGDAVAPLRRAEAADSDLVQARVYLARALLQSARTDEARELIARLAEQAPDESDVAILQGNYALQVEGDRDAGIAAFERAYALEPTDQRLIDLAIVNTQLGRVGPAIAEMEKRRAEQPLSARALSILGELYLAAARYEDAADAYQELSMQAPDDPAARNNLAWALLQLDRTEAANTAVQEALDLAPENAAILDTAGSIALARGEAAAAVSYLARAAAGAPDRADIQLNYADALLAHGKLDQARKVLGDLEGRDLGGQLAPRYEGLRARVQ